ncbi:hypothetical protein PCASD_13112 [Puccinia coronata f. sp. avenae]|uniref:Uncharacterized protein n=1 Tax=Puccinia coronata f. sp. avenae TaxID=200324 RepID=A0A2N5UDD6_9BASI|nr:hypothetical protein PCASD_13112 [Puccinia coronata f. sp. avenae]
MLVQCSNCNVQPVIIGLVRSNQSSTKLVGQAGTAGINRSNTAVRAVLEQPCLTGGRTGTVQPKHLPAGRTGLSDQFLGPVAQDQLGPVGQICPTSWLLLRSDSARPTTGRTRLFEHCSNCGVRSVNAGSAVQSPGLYWLQPPAAKSVAATDVTSVYQTDVTSAAPTDTLCLCSNVSVGPADIKLVWATDVTSVASGRRYRGGL